jgi:hypothetical protein
MPCDFETEPEFQRELSWLEEQELLRSEVLKFLAERCPASEVRRIGEEQAGFCANLWSEIAEPLRGAAIGER